jgi:hypothetical protein
MIRDLLFADGGLSNKGLCSHPAVAEAAVELFYGPSAKVVIYSFFLNLE